MTMNKSLYLIELKVLWIPLSKFHYFSPTHSNLAEQNCYPGDILLFDLQSAHILEHNKGNYKS